MDAPDAFVAEVERIHALLAPLSDEQLAAPTGFKEWTIDSIVQHLHWGNVAADTALYDEEAFLRMKNGGAKVMQEFMDNSLGSGNAELKGQRLVKAWIDYSRVMAEHFQAVDPKKRLKWFGPDMSARSSITVCVCACAFVRVRCESVSCRQD